MSKQIAKIPLNNVSKIQIYVSKCSKTLAQVKQATGANYIINGGMWNADGTPCLALKVDGIKLSTTQGWWSGIYGYGWNTGKDIKMMNDWDTPKNFISCTPLVRNGQKQSMSYGSSMGGKRGRTAIGLIGNTLVLYASQDGSSDAKTPENLQTEMFNMGCDSALMLDGGGSSQCDFEGKRITGDGRKCHNYICVWTSSTVTDPEPEEPDDGGESETVNEVWRITPSIGVNVRSGPGTSYSKTGAYSKGTLVTVTEKQNNWGKTTLGWFSLDYAELVSSQGGNGGSENGSTDTPTGDRVTDNGIVIKTHFITKGRSNRPAGKNSMASVTIHETDNFAATADAEAHGNYLDSESGEKSKTSWHYTVDDHAIVQHLPDNESAWHSATNEGNTTSIGIEICVNAGGDYNKARTNAEALVRLLMLEHSSIQNIYQHYHWSGKDCPHKLRSVSGAWDAFVAQCTKADGNIEPADDWAQSSWLKGFKKGITDGTNPTNPTTRQEVMVYFDRLGLLD